MRDDIYKNEGMAIFIKGKMVIGIHPNNLINNLSNLEKGNMSINWSQLAENAGVKLPYNTLSGIIGKSIESQ